MTEYNLKLPQQAVILVLQALGELPLKASINAFSLIQQQVQQQDEAGAVDLAKMPRDENEPRGSAL